MKITGNDVRRTMEFAKDYLLKIPNQCLLAGDTKLAVDGEKVAAAYVQAVLLLLNSKGLQTTDICIPFVSPDSEPQTDD